MLEVAIGGNNFSLARGKRLAIFGPSGCGKSQLLLCIAGLRYSPGSVCLDSQVWQDTDQFLAAHRRNIAMQFQHRELFSHLSVANNILFANNQLTRQSLTNNLVISELELAPLLAKPVNKLSGGEQQRVALARALIRDSALLILDEPFQGLDSKLKTKVLNLIAHEEISGERPTLFVSHDQSDIDLLADDTHIFRDQP